MTTDEILLAMTYPPGSVEHTTVCRLVAAALTRLEAIDRAAVSWRAARLGRVAWPDSDEYEALFNTEEALIEAIAGRESNGG